MVRILKSFEILKHTIVYVCNFLCLYNLVNIFNASVLCCYMDYVCLGVALNLDSYLFEVSNSLNHQKLV